MEMTTERYQALMDYLFKSAPQLFLTFHEYINHAVDEQGVGRVEVTRPPNAEERDYKDICKIVERWK
jgi:hypothetical protein